MARPATGQTPVITFRPPPQVRDDFDQRAKAAGRSRSDALIEAMHDWIKKQDRASPSAAAVLARAVAVQSGAWDTGRAVTALRDAGVPVAEGDRADEKQAREALRQLRDAGVLARVDSPGNTVSYQRITGGNA